MCIRNFALFGSRGNRQSAFFCCHTPKIPPNTRKPPCFILLRSCWRLHGALHDPDFFRCLGDQRWRLRVNVGLIEDDGNIVWQGEKTETNSYDFEYNYETADEVRTSRTEEDAKMAMVQIRYLTGGFADPSTVKIYIDGKELQVNDYAVYYDEWIKTNEDRVVDNDAFMFPIELTKSGFTDTLLSSWKARTRTMIVISETIKLTLRMEEHGFL